MERLKTLELNVQEGKVIVNGVEKSGVSYFNLEFDGIWSLTITENLRTSKEDFCVKSGKKIRPKESGE